MAAAKHSHSERNDAKALAGLSQLFTGVAEFPIVVKLLEAQVQEIQQIKREIAELLRRSQESREDGWMDAKRAAAYLCVSAGTFDKFRYSTHPKLKGYKAGGKTFYQRVDLDTFIKLFDVRSSGLG